MAIQSPLTITWTPPLTWGHDPAADVFEQPESQQPGLYMWGVQRPDGFLAYYVGETARPLATRLDEHRAAYLAGGYRLYELEPFMKGHLVVVWPGTWGGRRRERATRSEFLRRYSDLSSLVQQFLTRTTVLIAPFVGTDRLRKRAEAALASSLAAAVDPPFQERDIRYVTRSADEPAVQLRHDFPVPVVGAPAGVIDV